MGYTFQSAGKSAPHPSRHSFQRLLRSPASGYRNYTSGALTSVGTEGDFWASSPGSAGNTAASRFLFSVSGVLPLATPFRSFGFPVRCVQYLQAVFSSKECPERCVVPVGVQICYKKAEKYYFLLPARNLLLFLRGKALRRSVVRRALKNNKNTGIACRNACA